MTVLATLELHTHDRLVIRRDDLSSALAEALSRACEGREFYVIARVGDMRLDYGLKPIRPGEIAGIVAKELDHAARRYTLPIPLEANDKAVERLRDYLNRMHQVNRALAGIAFREALDEIVKLRTALALCKGEGDDS